MSSPKLFSPPAAPGSDQQRASNQKTQRARLGYRRADQANCLIVGIDVKSDNLAFIVDAVDRGAITRSSDGRGIVNGLPDAGQRIVNQPVCVAAGILINADHQSLI